MLEKLKEWLGIISKYEVATQKECLASFLYALSKSDRDLSGKISVKELIVLYKDVLISFPLAKDMSDDEIIARVESFLDRK